MESYFRTVIVIYLILKNESYAGKIDTTIKKVFTQLDVIKKVSL